MTDGVRRFLASITTEDDAAQIFDLVRVLSLAAGLVLIGLAVYQAVNDIQHFRIEETGRAFAEYFCGVGAALLGKGKGGQ
jgi:hypothetical protein